MAWGESNFYLALGNLLLADAGLVALIGDQQIGEIQNPEYRIGDSSPNVIQRTPYLGYYISLSLPLLDDVCSWRRSRVIFEISSTDRRLVTKVGDYLEGMLDLCCDRFSISDDNITNPETRFLQRNPPVEGNLGSDIWTSEIHAEFIWIGLPCVGDPEEPVVEICPIPDDDMPYGDRCPDD